MRYELYLTTVQSLQALSQFIGDKGFNKTWNFHILEAFQMIRWKVVIAS